MNGKFKFKIGETVLHKSTVDMLTTRHRMFGDDVYPPYVSVLTILERVQSECPGGTQNSYIIRHATSDGRSFVREPLKVQESELAPFDGKLVFGKEKKWDTRIEKERT